MSKQVRLPKISSILQNLKIGPTLIDQTILNSCMGVNNNNNNNRLYLKNSNVYTH